MVAHVTCRRLQAHRNAGAAVGRLAHGLVIFVGLLVALSVALPSFRPGYGDNVEKARGLILQAISSVEGVLADPAPDVLPTELASSTVNLRARWRIAPPKRADALDARDRVLDASLLTAEGIDLPFPTRQISFHDQTEPADGDRTPQREGWPA